MSMFWSSSCDSMHQLFLRQLRLLYDGELLMITAMPRLIEGAHSDRLRRACVEHLGEIDKQVRRIEGVFERLSLMPRRETAGVIRDLIHDAREVIDGGGEPAVRDAALIAALQTIEHVEIAAYGTAHAWALQLGLADAAEDLHETLREERSCDRSLTALAESGINAVATFSSQERSPQPL